jgi:hypothetical protein
MAKARTPSATTRAAGPVVCGVDPQLSAIDLLTVEAAYRLRRFRLAGELDEGEPSRAAGFAVDSDVNVRDLSGCSECGGELLLCSAEAQVTNVDPG